ncbi:autophagy-related protein 11, putative (ATG11), partial [Plasmodium malariae]
MIKFTEDEGEPYSNSTGDKNNLLLNKKKIEDLKKSIENLLNKDNSLSDLNNIKNSLRELELHALNNNN